MSKKLNINFRFEKPKFVDLGRNINLKKPITMKKTTVKAIFKGRNGSCGFKSKMEYTLTIRHKGAENIKVTSPETGTEPVEYQSMIAFLNNWDNIRKI